MKIGTEDELVVDLAVLLEALEDYDEGEVEAETGEHVAGIEDPELPKDFVDQGHVIGEGLLYTVF